TPADTAERAADHQQPGAGETACSLRTEGGRHSWNPRGGGLPRLQARAQRAVPQGWPQQLSTLRRSVAAQFPQGFGVAWQVGGASRLRCARNGNGPWRLAFNGSCFPSPHPGGGRTTLQTVLDPACTRPEPQAVQDGSLQSSRLRGSDAASVRLDAPILRSRLWMWLLIVCGLRHSRSAISALDR